jgi:hypothetical protein
MPSPGESDQDADLSPLARRLAAQRKTARVTDNARLDGTAPPDPDTGSVAGGIGLTLGLHVLFFATLFVADRLFRPFGAPYLFLLIGVTQLVYIVPVTFLAFRRGRASRAKGLIIGASATLLLNGLCWGALSVLFHPR